MLTLLVLIILLYIGIRLLIDSYKYEGLGLAMIMVFGIWLIIHSLCWGLTSYDYNLYMVKRTAFEQTLKSARENGNEYETAAIIKDVAEWNERLAEKQYDNKTLYLDQYVDDRFDLLEPIK